jgi:hypothetical protein
MKDLPYNLHLTAHCADRALHVRGTNQGTTSSNIIIDHSQMEHLVRLVAPFLPVPTGINDVTICKCRSAFPIMKELGLSVHQSGNALTIVILNV